MDNDAKKTHGSYQYKATWLNRYPLVFILALWQFLLYVCKFQWTEACLSTASSFYSAGGYAIREKKGLKKKLLIVIGGGGALFFALLAVCGKFFWTYFKPKEIWVYFNPNELDVMGSIFTQAKMYPFAMRCYSAIGGESLSTDATIALSIKWYYKQPHLTDEDKVRLKAKVLRLINLHPEWDDTILARLWEFLGEEEKQFHARRRIEQKMLMQ